MIIIILAAGYGTRLMPLTRDVPKPLIEVAGRPLLDYIVEDLDTISAEGRYVVSNNYYIEKMRAWGGKHKRYTVINDGTNGKDDRLGAIGDINYVLGQIEAQDDLLIVAGDNYLSESIRGIVEYGQINECPVLGVYDVGDLERIKELNELGLDKKGKIIYFEEKPKEPKNTLTGTAIYYYPAYIVPMIKEYIDEGNNPDQPGRLIQWLYKKVDCYTWKIPGVWYDIGTYESFCQADSYVKRNKRPF